MKQEIWSYSHGMVYREGDGATLASLNTTSAFVGDVEADRIGPLMAEAPAMAQALAEAHSMLADLREGFPMRELCRDPEEWLADARRTLESAGWTICR